MAQSVEHVIGNDEVIGSIPITSSKPEHNVFGFFLCKKATVIGGFFIGSSMVCSVALFLACPQGERKEEPRSRRRGWAQTRPRRSENIRTAPNT